MTARRAIRDAAARAWCRPWGHQWRWREYLAENWREECQRCGALRYQGAARE